MGAMAHPSMTVGKGPEDDFLKGVPLGYNEFIKHVKGFWPVPHLNGSLATTCQLLDAWQMAFLLIWLPSCWESSIEPCSCSALSPNNPMGTCLAPSNMHARFPKGKGIPSFPTCFKLFSESSRRRIPEEFLPFEAKKYSSKDFQKFSSQGFFRGDATWGSCLQSRDLVVIRTPHAGVEAYCPSLVARQFGLVQLLPVPPTWTKNTDWMARALISKDEAKQISVLAREQHIASFEAPKPLQQIFPSRKKVTGDSSQKLADVEVSSDLLITLVDIVTDKVDSHHAGLAEVAFDLRNQLMRCCQGNLLQDEAFEKAKRSVQSQPPLLMLPAPSDQGVRTLAKRKSSEVEEEAEPITSPKGAKTSGRKLIKTVAKKPSAKKVKVIEVIPDPPILDVEPLDEDLDDATTLSELTRKVNKQKQVLNGLIEAQKALEAEDRALAKKYKKAKKFAKLAAAALQAKTQAEDATKLATAFKAKFEAEKAERKRLEVKEEKKRQAEKAEEERVAEIARRLEAKKKAQAEKKRQEELEKKRKEEEKKKREEKQKKEEKSIEIEAVRKEKVEQVVSREAKLTKPAIVASVVSMQPVAQPTVKVRTSIEVTVPSIEAVASLEGLGDIDKLLEDVSLTLQQCQTPTKTSSSSISLEPSRDQLQTAISQLKELLQKPIGSVLLDATLRAQKCLELQTVNAESQGLVQGMELISKTEQDIQTLQSEIANLEMLPLMSWAGLFATFKEL
uniref:Aminotransferase-like plant mobile domain-containing protein n=1 Tax=Fagus sylvatica TaxID=28930 RepID=A0A2N9EPR3_FAGSY